MKTDIQMYCCPHCQIEDSIDSDLFYYDDDSMAHRCVDCDVKLNHLGSRRARFVSVAVYSLSRVYGGPEEGGWYYTEGYQVTETLRNFASDHYDGARDYFEDMRDEWEVENPGRYAVRVYQEKTAPVMTPSQRLHYC